MRSRGSPVNRYAVVLSTAPDERSARSLARALVRERLAACVSFVPGLVSLYRWKGRIERSGEILLVIKTRRDLRSKLFRRIKDLHPYEVPEILLLDIGEGDSRYLAWLRAETSPPQARGKTGR